LCEYRIEGREHFFHHPTELPQPQEGSIRNPSVHKDNGDLFLTEVDQEVRPKVRLGENEDSRLHTGDHPFYGPGKVQGHGHEFPHPRAQVSSGNFMARFRGSGENDLHGWVLVFQSLHQRNHGKSLSHRKGVNPDASRRLHCRRRLQPQPPPEALPVLAVGRRPQAIVEEKERPEASQNGVVDPKEPGMCHGWSPCELFVPSW